MTKPTFQEVRATLTVLTALLIQIIPEAGDFVATNGDDFASLILILWGIFANKEARKKRAPKVEDA